MLRNRKVTGIASRFLAWATGIVVLYWDRKQWCWKQFQNNRWLSLLLVVSQRSGMVGTEWEGDFSWQSPARHLLQCGFPAVQCRVWQENIFHLAFKNKGQGILPKDIFPAQICHWFFSLPIMFMMLLWLAPLNPCCLCSSAWEAFQRKPWPHMAKKLKINQHNKNYAICTFSKGKVKQTKDFLTG